MSIQVTVLGDSHGLLTVTGTTEPEIQKSNIKEKPMSKYKQMIQHLQDQIDNLDYQYWESSPSNHQKQIELLYKMIRALNTMLYQLAVKEEEQSNHQGENR